MVSYKWPGDRQPGLQLGRARQEGAASTPGTPVASVCGLHKFLPVAQQGWNWLWFLTWSQVSLLTELLDLPPEAGNSADAWVLSLNKESFPVCRGPGSPSIPPHRRTLTNQLSIQRPSQPQGSPPSPLDCWPSVNNHHG